LLSLLPFPTKASTCFSNDVLKNEKLSKNKSLSILNATNFSLLVGMHDIGTSCRSNALTIK
jgi:hypothetical protein